MEYLRYFSVFLGALAFPVLGVEYKTWKLGEHCGETIRLECPDTDSALNRGGILTFNSMDDKTAIFDCQIKLSFGHWCPPSNDFFAIYTNIRESIIPGCDSIQIYETQAQSKFWSHTKIVKTFSGGRAFGYSDPQSVGQIRTQYSRRPVLIFRYISNSGFHGNVTFDFNILKLSSSSNVAHESYCESLNGYVHTEVFCDSDNRINCPKAYSRLSNPLTGNAASGIDQRSCRLHPTAEAIEGDITGSFWTPNDVILLFMCLGLVCFMIGVFFIAACCVANDGGCRSTGGTTSARAEGSDMVSVDSDSSQCPAYQLENRGPPPSYEIVMNCESLLPPSYKELLINHTTHAPTI